MRLTDTRGYPVPDGDDFADGNSSLWQPSLAVERDLNSLERYMSAAYDRPTLILSKPGGEQFTSADQRYSGMDTVFDNFNCFCHDGVHRDFSNMREWWRVGWFIGLTQPSSPAGWRRIRIEVNTRSDPLNQDSEAVYHRWKFENDGNTGGECLLIDTVVQLISGGSIDLYVSHNQSRVDQTGVSYFWAQMLRSEVL